MSPVFEKKNLAKMRSFLLQSLVRLRAGGSLQRRCAQSTAHRAAPAFGSPRRVVVTGVGLVTPVGVGASVTWEGLMTGQSGVVKLDEERFQSLPSRVAGKVPVGTNHGEYNAADWMELSEARRLPTGIQYGLAAVQEAVTDAGWSGEHNPFDPIRTGVAIGTGISGAEDLLDGHDTLNSRG